MFRVAIVVQVDCPEAPLPLCVCNRRSCCQPRVPEVRWFLASLIFRFSRAFTLVCGSVILVPNIGTCSAVFRGLAQSTQEG
jgi:hypothetical protein